MDAQKPEVSIIIPARDEEGHICDTVRDVVGTFSREGIRAEVIVVLDRCTDGTEEILDRMAKDIPEVRTAKTSSGRHGIGHAIAVGLGIFRGEAAIIMMADGSDRSGDAVSYFRKIQEGYDCAFGSRFIRGGKCIDYPPVKLFLNRMANNFIRVIFGIGFDDTTNAFKAYSRSCVQGILPVISHHFNVTVELPLKAMIRGYRHAVIPIQWTNRKCGVSKLKIQEMGSRYLFICLYLWLEKNLSRGDYLRQDSCRGANSSGKDRQG